MLQTDRNLELKQGRYDQSKQCCAKSILLRDCIWDQFLLVVWVEFWVSPFGLIFCGNWGILGFPFSLTLFLVVGLFLVILILSKF